MSADFRFDPFDEKFLPIFRTGELYTAKTFPELNGRTGFFLRELPQRRIPSTVALTGADLSPLSEVSRTISPGVSEFRVDYSQLFFWSSGFVEVHASRAGEQFAAAYHGLGAGLNWSNRTDARYNVERSVNFEKSLTAVDFRALKNARLKGSVSLSSLLASQIFANSKRIQNVGDAVDDADLLNIQTLLSYNVQGGVDIFVGPGGTTPASGNWTPPRNTRYVFVAMIGSGGGGTFPASPTLGGGGGGGSPALYAIVDLQALGTGPYAYYVPGRGPFDVVTNPGTNGEHSTFFGCSSGYGNGGNGSTGGAFTAGTLGGAVIIGRTVTTDHLNNPINGGNGTATLGGAGGNGASMLGSSATAANGASNRLFSGNGGPAPDGAFVSPAIGGFYGGGGSGRNPPSGSGRGGGRGVILIIY